MSSRQSRTLKQVLSSGGQLGPALQGLLGDEVEAPGKGGHFLRALRVGQH